MEEILLAWIRSARGRHFSLIIAGRLSGIHSWKSTHVPLDYEVDDDSTVIIYFDRSERLSISDAQGVVMQPNGELWVGDAHEVRFTWNSDKDPNKDCEEIFKKVGKSISFDRTDDLYTTGMAYGSLEGEFVVLRAV
jgi:hypothetical protein